MIYKNNEKYDLNIGVNKVIPNHSTFPIFVEYIENTQQNWFSIPIYQSLGVDYIVKVTASVTQSIGNTALFVGYYNGIGFSVRKRFAFSAGSDYVDGIPIDMNHIYDFMLYRDSNNYRCCKIGNYMLQGTPNTSVDNKIGIFHQQEYSGYHKGKIFLIIVYRNGDVVNELRPCLSVENGHINEPSLYDCIEDKYYYNEGVGTFSVGNRI